MSLRRGRRPDRRRDRTVISRHREVGSRTIRDGTDRAVHRRSPAAPARAGRRCRSRRRMRRGSFRARARRAAGTGPVREGHRHRHHRRTDAQRHRQRTDAAHRAARTQHGQTRLRSLRESVLDSSKAPRVGTTGAARRIRRFNRHSNPFASARPDRPPNVRALFHQQRPRNRVLSNKLPGVGVHGRPDTPRLDVRLIPMRMPRCPWDRRSHGSAGQFLRRAAANIASVPCRCGHSCTCGPGPRSVAGAKNSRVSSAVTG